MMDIKLQQIIDSINRGEVVCFPTETLYALAVDAYNLNAINSLYKLKQRAKDKPYAIMLHSIDQLVGLVDSCEERLRLMQKHLPGPVTFLLNRSLRCNLPSVLGDKIGIRIPRNQEVLQILQKLNKPLATTSANISSEQDAKRFEDITPNVLEGVSCYLSDNQGVSGVASTVVDISVKPFVVLRQGNITV